MHITQEADYAVRIVFCLSRGGGRLDARTISEEMGVTLRFSLKILHKLTGAGVVKSFKGTRGGYELAQPAGKTTLRQVIEAVDGPAAISRCIGDGGECNRGASGCCAFQRVFADITEEVNKRLSDVTFQQLVEDAQNI